MNLLQDLEFRGLIYQITDKAELAKRLAKGPVTLYCGFDPSSDSLTIGNLQQVLLLKRFQQVGHQAIALAGGATGMIGDPSGKEKERTLLDKQTLNHNLKAIKKQLKDILGRQIKMVNNYDWLAKINVIDYLREYGKFFPVNVMLSKETVKARLESGISFTEFNYMILQSIDFLNLFKKYNCELQIGGSDQWGNITTGVDLIRKKENQTVFGLTSPLITKADGGKFGKTESGTVWLDKQKTSAYEFYQFFINTADADVINFLKRLTFLSEKEINKLAEEVKNAPEKRLAQKRLAQEVTQLVHGKKDLQEVEKISQALFKGDVKKLNEKELAMALSNLPSWENCQKQRKLLDLLLVAGIESSKRQAREDIQNGAIYLNNQRCQDLDKIIKPSDFLYNKFLVIRKGKKNQFLIKW